MPKDSARFKILFFRDKYKKRKTRTFGSYLPNYFLLSDTEIAIYI